MRLVKEAVANHFEMVCIKLKYLTPEIVRESARLGIWHLAWATGKSVSRWRELAQSGLGGVITEHKELAKTVAGCFKPAPDWSVEIRNGDRAGKLETIGWQIFKTPDVHCAKQLLPTRFWPGCHFSSRSSPFHWRSFFPTSAISTLTSMSSRPSYSAVGSGQLCKNGRASVRRLSST